jgi:hypothetical protein
MLACFTIPLTPLSADHTAGAPVFVLLLLPDEIHVPVVNFLVDFHPGLADPQVEFAVLLLALTFFFILLSLSQALGLSA